MRISTALGTVLLILPGTALSATLQHREALPEDRSVVPKDVPAEQPHQLQKRNPAAALLWFGQFALEYAMGKALDSIFDEDAGPPPISAADLDKFGDEMLKGIESIVTVAISEFQEQRDKQHVDADLKVRLGWTSACLLAS